MFIRTVYKYSLVLFVTILPKIPNIQANRYNTYLQKFHPGCHHCCLGTGFDTKSFIHIFNMIGDGVDAELKTSGNILCTRSLCKHHQYFGLPDSQIGSGVLCIDVLYVINECMGDWGRQGGFAFLYLLQDTLEIIYITVLDDIAIGTALYGMEYGVLILMRAGDDASGVWVGIFELREKG